MRRAAAVPPPPPFGPLSHAQVLRLADATSAAEDAAMSCMGGESMPSSPARAAEATGMHNAAEVLEAAGASPVADGAEAAPPGEVGAHAPLSSGSTLDEHAPPTSSDALCSGCEDTGQSIGQPRDRHAYTAAPPNTARAVGDRDMLRVHSPPPRAPRRPPPGSPGGTDDRPLPPRVARGYEVVPTHSAPASPDPAAAAAANGSFRSWSQAAAAGEATAAEASELGAAAPVAADDGDDAAHDEWCAPVGERIRTPSRQALPSNLDSAAPLVLRGPQPVVLSIADLLAAPSPIGARASQQQQQQQQRPGSAQVTRRHHHPPRLHHPQRAAGGYPPPRPAAHPTTSSAAAAASTAAATRAAVARGACSFDSQSSVPPSHTQLLRRAAHSHRAGASSGFGAHQPHQPCAAAPRFWGHAPTATVRRLVPEAPQHRPAPRAKGGGCTGARQWAQRPSQEAASLELFIGSPLSKEAGAQRAHGQAHWQHVPPMHRAAPQAAARRRPVWDRPFVPAQQAAQQVEQPHAMSSHGEAT